MVEKEFERNRLVFKPFSTLTDDEKKIIVKSWENPFNARYNKTKDANESVEKISRLAQPTFKKLEQYEDCMYFRAVFDKTTGELIGNCRFGKYYKSKTNECWDFGFNVLLKHWLKGYGTEIIGKITVPRIRQSVTCGVIGNVDHFISRKHIIFYCVIDCDRGC